MYILVAMATRWLPMQRETECTNSNQKDLARSINCIFEHGGAMGQIHDADEDEVEVGDDTPTNEKPTETNLQMYQQYEGVLRVVSMSCKVQMSCSTKS